MAQQFKLILGQSGWQVTSRAFMLTWWEAIYVLYDMPFFLALAQGWTFWERGSTNVVKMGTYQY